MKKTGFNLIVIMLILIGIYFFLAPKKDEFAENDVYNDIINRGYIKVGINTDSKPFGFYDSKGVVSGYDADLAHYIAQYIVKNPAKVQFVSVTPSSRLIKASTGEVDIVISTITITPQRQEVVAFSIPYDVAGQSVLINSGSAIKSISDLAGQNIGVIFGTTAEKNIKTLVPTANVIGFKSYNDAYKALKSKKIGAITDDDTILGIYAVSDQTVKLLPKRYSKEPYGIAFKKGDTTIKLKENLDFAIRDLEQKGVLNRIRKKWKIG